MRSFSLSTVTPRPRPAFWASGPNEELPSSWLPSISIPLSRPSSARARGEAKLRECFQCFENALPTSLLPEPPQPPPPRMRVFIGHGRDPQWRDLKDHLVE